MALDVAIQNAVTCYIYRRTQSSVPEEQPGGKQGESEDYPFQHLFNQIEGYLRAFSSNSRDQKSSWDFGLHHFPKGKRGGKGAKVLMSVEDMKILYEDW